MTLFIFKTCLSGFDGREGLFQCCCHTGSGEFKDMLLMFVNYKLRVIIFLVNPELAHFYLLPR